MKMMCNHTHRHATTTHFSKMAVLLIFPVGVDKQTLKMVKTLLCVCEMKGKMVNVSRSGDTYLSIM